MFAFIILLCLLTTGIQASSSSSESEENSQYVKILNTVDFEQQVLVPNSGISFVMFYATFCPTCRMFKPYWENVGKLLKDELQRVVKFNCEKDYDTCYDFCIKQFPTFVVFNNGKMISSFEDDFDDEVLVDWITSKDYLLEEYKKSPRSRGKC
ncbi:hypothetical protein PVAND_013269 [Polypedilum vanderplanki]|uniref:Thioredoxin domain-containing protein n=1 Tax=Polypedilum vanderplanki TaxID=319348 RepID=A0A9J6CPY9_POLVA|nr:hypothetical protein PVAND_013269 [Polypedilum vanderplanki]